MNGEVERKGIEVVDEVFENRRRKVDKDIKKMQKVFRSSGHDWKVIDSSFTDLMVMYDEAENKEKRIRRMEEMK